MPAKKNTAFKATAAQRRIVGTLIENGMTLETVRTVILHQITGKPITMKILRDHFKGEIGERNEGAPLFKPTQLQRTQVEEMLGSSFTHDEIAMSIINPRSGKGISKSHLRRAFPDELARGKTTIGIKVRSKLLERALDDDHPGCTSSLIFWLKTQEGFREKYQIEHTAGTGVLVAPATVTPEDWIARAAERNGAKTSPVDD